MILNCKPGDVAMVTRAAGHLAAEFLGRVLTVTQWELQEGVALWRYEGPTLFCRCCGKHRAISFADRILTPLRPNDGVDEVIRRIGKPRKLKSKSTQ